MQSKPSASELEMAWVFHSGIFYYGVRKYIYEAPVLEDKEQMISDALDVFLAGYRAGFWTRESTRHAGAGESGRLSKSADQAFAVSARYQSPISLAVISATPSWPMT